VTAESVPEDADVVYDMSLINSIPSSLLFDSRASHSFITKAFVEKHNIPNYPLKKKLLIRSPGRELRATHSYPQTKIEIRGLSFLVELIILESSGIDVILRIDYLTKYDGVISCAKRMVTLTSPLSHPGFRDPGTNIITRCAGTKSHTYDESWYNNECYNFTT
jgi:hypothetical protein